MSFLFGKKNKQQTNALPPATRDITSAHGQGQPSAAANGGGIRDVEKTRGGPQPQPQPQPQTQTSTPGGSVNNSLSSLQNQASATTPEPKALREKTDLNVQVRPLRVIDAARMLTCLRMQTPGSQATPQILPTHGPLGA